MKKKILIAVVAVLIFITGLFCAKFIKPPSSGVRYTDSIIATKAETSYITIQGFSELHFSANEITQDFKFQNPNDNDCYMNIIFCLPDGEVLFFIGNIQPSYGIEQVEFNVGEECSINAVEINISPNKAVYVDLALSPDEYVTIHSENSDDTLDVYFVNSDGEPLSVTNMTLARFDSGSENSSQTFSTYVSETTGKTAGVYTGTAMFNIYCD